MESVWILPRKPKIFIKGKTSVANFFTQEKEDSLSDAQNIGHVTSTIILIHDNSPT